MRDLLADLLSSADAPDAAESARLDELADTLVSARARLLEIAAAERDPRLSALLTRLERLGAELAGAAPANDADNTIAFPVARKGATA